MKAKEIIKDVESYLQINYGDKGHKHTDQPGGLGAVSTAITGEFPAAKIAKYIATKTDTTIASKTTRWIDLANGISIQKNGTKGVSVLIPDKLK